MNSLIAWIRNCLRLLRLKATAFWVEASIANAEADMALRAAELVKCKAIYYRRIAALRTIRCEIAVRESPEVIVKQIIKGNWQ